MSHYYLNEDKTYRPASLHEWATQFEHMERHVGDDQVNGKHVSTVWLGLDHNYYGGLPLVFETMVFNEDGSDIYCERYTTWQEAEEGHQKATQWVKNGCKSQ